MACVVQCCVTGVQSRTNEHTHALQERSGRAAAGSSPTGRTAPARVSAHCPAAAGGGAALAACGPGHPSPAVPGHIQGKWPHPYATSKCLQPGVYKATCQQIQHDWMSGGWVVCLVSSWQRLKDERTRCESMACAWQITEICRTSLHLLFCC